MKVDWNQKLGFIEFCIARGDNENAAKLIDQENKRLRSTQIGRQLAQLAELRSQVSMVADPDAEHTPEPADFPDAEDTPRSTDEEEPDGSVRASAA